jgi:hypothetical protein
VRGTFPVVSNLDAVELAHLTFVRVAHARDAATHVRDVADDPQTVDVDVDHHVEAATVQLKLALGRTVRVYGRVDSFRTLGPQSTMRTVADPTRLGRK